MSLFRGRSPRPIRSVSSGSAIASVIRNSSPRSTKIATVTLLARGLTALGFRVFPSQTNFLLVRPPVFRAGEWRRKLRDRKILVRWFDYPETSDYLRITIGRDDEMAALLKAARAILSQPPA